MFYATQAYSDTISIVATSKYIIMYRAVSDYKIYKY